MLSLGLFLCTLAVVGAQYTYTFPGGASVPGIHVNGIQPSISSGSFGGMIPPSLTSGSRGLAGRIAPGFTSASSRALAERILPGFTTGSGFLARPQPGLLSRGMIGVQPSVTPIGRQSLSVRRGLDRGASVLGTFRPGGTFIGTVVNTSNGRIGVRPIASTTRRLNTLVGRSAIPSKIRGFNPMGGISRTFPSVQRLGINGIGRGTILPAGPRVPQIPARARRLNTLVGRSAIPSGFRGFNPMVGISPTFPSVQGLGVNGIGTGTILPAGPLVPHIPATARGLNTLVGRSAIPSKFGGLNPMVGISPTFPSVQGLGWNAIGTGRILPAGSIAPNRLNVLQELTPPVMFGDQRMMTAGIPGFRGQSILGMDNSLGLMTG